MNRALIFILIGTIMVMSVTVALYVVFMEFKPEKEIRLMLASMSQLTGLSQNTGINWTRNEQETLTTTTIFLNGKMDLHDASVFNHQTSFRVVQVSHGKDYTDFSGELRTVGGKTYLTYVPPGPTISQVDFSKAETWVSFLPGEFALWGPVLPGVQSPINVTMTTSWSPEQMLRVRELLSIADVFLVSFDGQIDEIRGQKTRLLNARFDHDALNAFLLAIFEVRENRSPTNEERLTLQANVAQLERLAIKFWIGKKDHRLYRIHAQGSFNDQTSSTSMPVDLRVEFSDMNQQVDFEIPISVIPFSDLMSSTLSSSADAFFGSFKTFVNPQQISLPTQMISNADDEDQDGLDKLLEGFYFTNAKRSDTDGDGMNDGDEVSAGRNPRGKGSLFGFGL